jgi:hypothetical protein
VSRYCFITGFLRSGTTLVEKLMHSLPGGCIGPQPFPFLYHDLKRLFLRSYGEGDERYPLGHLFREDRYGPEDFQAFLTRHRVTPEAVATSFARMRGYSGWQLPALAAHAEHVGEGSFAQVYRALCDGLPEILGRDPSALIGAKEVFCEEFVPYLIAEGVSTILVVRDIRDVLTSLKLGGGGTYGDSALPVLHIVRQWRKSVAFALEFAGRPGFELVRYEELVAHPYASLERLAERMHCESPAAGTIGEIRDQEGREWEGNSSFGPVQGISRDAVGRFADRLPPTWAAAVESLCAPEMRAMGLAPTAGGDIDDRHLAETVERAANEMDLVGPAESLAEELAAERERARMIVDGDAAEREQRRCFIFPGAYRRLAQAAAAPLPALAARHAHDTGRT